LRFLLVSWGFARAGGRSGRFSRDAGSGTLRDELFLYSFGGPSGQSEDDAVETFVRIAIRNRQSVDFRPKEAQKAAPP